MLPFRKVLFPVDYSDSCSAAIPYVKGMVERYDAELRLVHAYGSGLPPDFLLADPTLPDRIQEFEAQRLRKFAEEYFGHGAKTTVQTGESAAVIHNLLQREQADLIMLPTHGRGLGRRLLIGSVTTKVLHDSSVPVWTATSDALNRPHQPYASVLCACDLGNDEESKVILKAAASIAAKYGATLSLLNILELVPMAMEMDYAAFRTSLRDAADARLQELKKSLGIQAPHRVAEGAVSTAIREEAIRCKADLIVTGRGYQQGAVGRLWSSLYQIVREAPCPVLSI